MVNHLLINIPNDRGKLYEVIKFPAGEIQVRLTPEGIFACAGKDSYTIEANPIPDIIELAQLKSALDGLGDSQWFSRKLELPYLPYARADRRFTPGDAAGMEVYAGLINSLGFQIVYTFDVHSKKSLEMVKGAINLDPVHHYDQLTGCIKHLGRDGLCLVIPDKGATGRYDLEHYRLPILHGDKLRDAKTGKLSGFYIDPKIIQYKKALIVDDICDGGGTFIGLAEEIRAVRPDIQLGLYVSHGIFSQGLGKLRAYFGSNLFISDFSYKGNWDAIFSETL